MKKARALAQHMRQQYYAARGVELPEKAARRLRRRIHVRTDGTWRSKPLLDRTLEVLNSANFAVEDVLALCGVRIDYDDLRYLDRSEATPVLGCAWPDCRAIQVCYRAVDYEPLFRSTVWHELGHVLMHGKRSERCLLYKPDEQPRSIEEREANAFMHAAMLPGPLIGLGVAYVCHWYRVHPTLAFHSANTLRGRWLWRHCIFRFLIDKLCVSREMLVLHMRNCHAFNRETARYHLSYRLRNRWQSGLLVPDDATMAHGGHKAADPALRL